MAYNPEKFDPEESIEESKRLFGGDKAHQTFIAPEDVADESYRAMGEHIPSPQKRPNDEIEEMEVLIPKVSKLEQRRIQRELVEAVITKKNSDQNEIPEDAPLVEKSPSQNTDKDIARPKIKTREITKNQDKKDVIRYKMGETRSGGKDNLKTLSEVKKYRSFRQKVKDFFHLEKEYQEEKLGDYLEKKMGNIDDIIGDN